MVLVFLLMAFMAMVILLAGFGVITGGVNEAVSSSGNYCDNVSDYPGFTSTITSYPLLIWLIFGGMVVFGVWQFIRRWKTKESEGNG